MTEVHEDVIPGADGMPVGLTVHRADEPLAWVVFCHGFKGFRKWGGWGWMGERMAGRGVTHVAFDFSHNGVAPDSPAEFSRLDLFERNTWSRELADLVAVVEWARADGLAGAPVLVGHSKGGATAILGAEVVGARGVVGLATVGDTDRLGPEGRAAMAARGNVEFLNARTGQMMRLGPESVEDLDAHADAYDLADLVGRRGPPILLVHGTADEGVDISEARGLAAAARPGRVRMVEIDGAGHTFGTAHPYAGPTPEFERAIDLAADFALSLR